MYATDRAPRAFGETAGSLVGALRHPRYEVFPVTGIEDTVAAHAPAVATITVTASPRQGIDASVDLVQRLRERGLNAVPHLSARLIASEVHLKDILQRLEELAVSEVFVVAGDPEQPTGPYAGAVDVLEAMHQIGHGFEQVGITGYPESHPKIADDVTVQAMWDKRRYATYVVSQMCFDPVAVNRWVTRLRNRGITLPVYVGIPGPTALGTLMRLSRKVGVGDSSRFLSNQGKGLLRLGKPGRFTPDRLVDKLLPRYSSSHMGAAGLHFYTFNNIAAAEQWRKAKLGRLGMT